MTPKEAKNYVAGTLERDQPYERLLRQVVLDGELTHDRTGVGTLSTFGTRMEFNLQDGFPLVTTKKVFLRGIIAELLWFIAGDNKVSTLQKQNVHIWDEWVLPDGTIGKGYPIQWRSWPKTDGTKVDQLSNALDLIRHNPSSRRIIISAWNAGELDEMALPPCRALFQFHVRGNKFLDCQLYQRSADMFLGVPFNIASYSLLTMMMAQQAGLEPGRFIWVGGDTHVYLNHLEQVCEQLSREPRPWPHMEIDKADSLFDYKPDMFHLIDYDPWPSIKAPVAV